MLRKKAKPSSALCMGIEFTILACKAKYTFARQTMEPMRTAQATYGSWCYSVGDIGERDVRWSHRRLDQIDHYSYYLQLATAVALCTRNQCAKGAEKTQSFLHYK
jgi:hypothetical protein